MAANSIESAARQAIAAGLDPAELAGAESPLDAAVSARDREVLALVRHALRNRRMILAFQPVVGARPPHDIVFHEGLMRVLDRTGRVIPARDFIGAVERHELGRVIDCFALQQGLGLLREQRELRLSINMSARSIGYPRWIDTLRRGLLPDPTLGERLILEISESSAMLMPELVSTFMRNLQRRGVTFALDDFGAGFTSFGHLRDFYFDMAKIDGQFTQGISSDADNQVLAAALLSVAQQFEMVSVAEAVENAADCDYLANAGFACLQGYHFGAPTTRPPWARTAPATSARGVD